MFPVLLALLLSLAVLPVTGIADVYKYVDADGRIHFTDSPLAGDEYSLEWQRAAAKVVSESRKKKIIASGRRMAAPRLPKDLSSRRARFARLIEQAARENNLYPELIHAVVRTESAYDPSAVSSAGAIGLMQLMPPTAERFGVNDIWDPVENLRGGARYLRELLDLFGHDLRLALAAYNAGENAVAKYGNRIPPYPETQRYVRKVLQFLWAERASAGGS